MTETSYKQPTRAEIDARDAEDIRRATERRLANPNAAPDAEEHRRHVQVTKCLNTGGKLSDYCSCYHCCISVCETCGAFEGSLTSHCPGERVDYDTQQAVYRTDLDYTTQRGWHLSGAGMADRRALFAKPTQNGAS